MRIQALFMKENRSWNLVMHSILQVVDAFYTSLQIRCTAHNQPIAEVAEYKKQYHKGRLFLSLCIAVHNEFIWRSQHQSEKVKATSKNRFLVGSLKVLA